MIKVILNKNKDTELIKQLISYCNNNKDYNYHIDADMFVFAIDISK